jgi:hypothetical protein
MEYIVRKFILGQSSMTTPKYRSDISRERITLKIRRIEENRYRLTDLKGRGLEYRKRADLSPVVASRVDAAAGKEILIEARLNRHGRWLIVGLTPDKYQSVDISGNASSN